jgi:hypothetical protein
MQATGTSVAQPSQKQSDTYARPTCNATNGVAGSSICATDQLLLPSEFPLVPPHIGTRIHVNEPGIMDRLVYFSLSYSSGV